MATMVRANNDLRTKIGAGQLVAKNLEHRLSLLAEGARKTVET